MEFRRNAATDLSSLIISMEEIIGKLNSFFTDSVVLKMNFEIESLGSEVESQIGYSSDEIAGQAFSKICTDHRIVDIVSEELKPGYFVGLITTFLNRHNEPLTVSISGFYLGLISDINGYIILKIKPLEDNSFLRKELVTRKRDLDSFIYRTAHDLRGPIATIKGLVNLIKLRRDDHEVDELTSLIEVHANKLDDRLFRLLYVADDNSEADDCTGLVDFEKLKCVLQQTLKDNFQIENMVFDFHVQQPSIRYINEFRLTRMLSNLLLYIVGLPVATVHAAGQVRIDISFEILPKKLKVRIGAKGFLASENIREVICQPVSLYNDILNYPSLFNYYVAQRESRQLNGVLSVEFADSDEQLLLISIPMNFGFDQKNTNPSPSPYNPDQLV